MRHLKFLYQILLLLGFAILFVGCAQETETQEKSVGTDILPTETQLPPTSTEDSTTPTTEHIGPTWLYIAIGDSTVVRPGIGVKGHYKEMLEEDLGVEVVLQSEAILSGGAKRMIEKLETTELQDALRSADVVTIQIPIHNMEEGLRLYDTFPEECGGDDHQDCLRDTFNQYKADTNKIFEMIMTYVDPSKQIIRAQDMYLINVTWLKSSGKFEIYNAYWKDAQKHIHDVAAQYGIPCASVYDAFMGPNGTDDPAEKGLMSDITHASEEGAILMAELIRELGYDYYNDD